MDAEILIPSFFLLVVITVAALSVYMDYVRIKELRADGYNIKCNWMGCEANRNISLRYTECYINGIAVNCSEFPG